MLYKPTPPEVSAVVSPHAAAPEAPVAEAQAPGCDLGDLDPSVVSGVIWSLFSDLPKDKKKEVMIMLVGEM